MRRLININILRLLPVIFSSLVLSAHFARGDIFILSLICFLILLLLFIKQRWVARLIQIVLIIGSIEWIRTLFYYVNQRQTAGEPYFRLVVIIGVVALLTGMSALVFRNQFLKERYKL